MSGPIITDRTRALAERSANCVVCRRARRQQHGFAFWVVKTFEGLCPFCRAYAKVYGRRSHEPVPAEGPGATQLETSRVGRRDRPDAGGSAPGL